MTLRTAVIGVGAMGVNHARIYADMPEVELVAVADSESQLLENIQRRFHVETFQDPIELLETMRPDAVSIAVPTVEHPAVALAAIEAGAHILLEKPIAFSLDEAERIIQAADQANVKLMVGHIERFNPAISELRARLIAGELGRVYQIDARREGPFPARVQDVGVVVDLAVHDLDVIRYVTGSEFTRVYAETERKIHSTHEDLLAGLLRLADGIVCTLSVNWLTPTKIREILVVGERGMFRVDYLTQDLYFFENAVTQSPDWDALQMLRGVSEGRMIRYVVAKKEPLRAEIEAFVGCVKSDTAPPVSGADALQALALAKAIVQSGQENRVIELHRPIPS